MIKGTTKSGFRFKITDEAQDDWELIEMAIDVKDDDSMYSAVKLVRKMLGEKQYKNLKKYCTKNGHVSALQMATEIGEIINFNGETKN